MGATVITTDNIEEFRGALRLKHGDLPFQIWDVFDYAAFRENPLSLLVPLNKLVSTKNELRDPKFLCGQKQDPRLTAFQFMQISGKESGNKRVPLLVRSTLNGLYEIIDGNATAQMLMLVGWNTVPVVVVES